MAELKELQVGFRKTVSDGQYGNETHEARLTVTPTEDEAIRLLETLWRLSVSLEEHVNDRFRQSSNEHIRYAMESTEEREARYKREAEERKARLQQERAELEARLAAQAARDDASLFVGGDEEDAEDEDDDDDSSF